MKQQQPVDLDARIESAREQLAHLKEQRRSGKMDSVNFRKPWLLRALRARLAIDKRLQAGASTTIIHPQYRRAILEDTLEEYDTASDESQGSASSERRDGFASSKRKRSGLDNSPYIVKQQATACQAFHQKKVLTVYHQRFVKEMYGTIAFFKDVLSRVEAERIETEKNLMDRIMGVHQETRHLRDRYHAILSKQRRELRGLFQQVDVTVSESGKEARRQYAHSLEDGGTTTPYQDTLRCDQEESTKPSDFGSSKRGLLARSQSMRSLVGNRPDPRMAWASTKRNGWASTRMLSFKSETTLQRPKRVTPTLREDARTAEMNPVAAS